jgi:predicted small secreted protein
MPTLRTTLAAVLAILTLAACETVEGAGQDIETLGESLQEESNEAQY